MKQTCSGVIFWREIGEFPNLGTDILPEGMDQRARPKDMKQCASFHLTPLVGGVRLWVYAVKGCGHPIPLS